MPRNKDHLYEIQENEFYNDVMFIPDGDDSEGSENVFDEDLEVNENSPNEFDFSYPPQSYSKIYDNYNNSQKKLEETHNYNWIEGEKIYENPLVNEILLKDADRKKILNSSHVELFEYFFSDEFKTYIIEATKENGYELTLSDLNTFVGIIIFLS